MHWAMSLTSAPRSSPTPAPTSTPFFRSEIAAPAARSQAPKNGRERQSAQQRRAYGHRLAVAGDEREVGMSRCERARERIRGRLRGSVGCERLSALTLAAELLGADVAELEHLLRAQVERSSPQQSASCARALAARSDRGCVSGARSAFTRPQPLSTMRVPSV